MIYITRDISIDEQEIQETFIRASGPGGQNVNKVSTAVQLRFDVRHSPSLPGEVRQRLMRLAGKRITGDGVLIIEARRYRHQERNRQDALDRLKELVRKAAIKPKTRKKTQPSEAARQKRLESKRRTSEKKHFRRQIIDVD